MTENGSEKSWWFPKISDEFPKIDFQTLPKIEMSADVPKSFEHFRSYLEDENFSVL